MVSQVKTAVAKSDASSMLDSHLQKAKHCWELGRWQDAISHCRLHLESHPGELEAQVLIGDAQLQLGWLEAEFQQI